MNRRVMAVDSNPMTEDIFSARVGRAKKGKATNDDYRLIVKQCQYDRDTFPFFNVVLSTKQRQLLELFQSGVLRVVVSGGNRSGKTIVESFFLICMMSGYWPARWEKVNLPDNEVGWHPILEEANWFASPCNAWVSSITRDVQIAAGGIQDAIVAMLPEAWIEKVHVWNSRYILSITLKNGSECQFKTAEAGPEKFQAATIDVLLLDELHPKDVWEEATSRIGGRPLRIFYAYFPRQGMDWTFKTFFRVGASPGPSTMVDYLSIMDNPFIPRKVRDAQIEEWKKMDQGDSRIYGRYVELSGIVYNFNKEVNSGNIYNPQTHPLFVATGTPPSAWPQWLAIDSHNSQKGVYCLFAALAPNRRRFYWQEYVSRGSPDDWCRELKVIIKGLNIIECFLDPSARSVDAHGYCIARHLENSLRIPMRDANRARGIGILAVQRGFGKLLDAQGQPVDGGPGICISMDCPILINQLEMYSRKSSTLGDVVKEDDEGPDCIRYIEVEDIAGDPEGDGKEARETSRTEGFDHVETYKKQLLKQSREQKEVEYQHGEDTERNSFSRTI
jgi:hypothetical protein